MGTAVFVGNLDLQTSKQELEEFFSAAGGVLSVRIPFDRVTRAPRGFAFVDFADRETAERAIRELDGSMLGGRRLRLKWALDKSPHPAPTRPGAAAAAPSSTLDDPDPVDWAAQALSELADHAPNQRRKAKRGGKHGSDRRHGQGVRRYID